MTSLKKIKLFFAENPIPSLMLLSFLVWGFAFRHFLFDNNVPLISDATSYYDHIKFYLDNLSRGVYPLWNPTWSGGAPNEFFLRRLGSFNPFLFLTLFLNKIGMSYDIAYRLYLAAYYFLEMIGFYKLARCVLNDRRMAFAAFLLFLFSSLGVRLFDAYLNLFLTPIIWFFYFLVSSAQKPDRFSVLGMTFCLMIILTTYIPFYFLVIFLSFLAFFFIFYSREARGIILKYFKFIQENKIFTFFCLAFFTLAVIPGLMLYKAGGSGEFVLPNRHALAAGHPIAVDPSWVNSWAILEEILYSSVYLRDLSQFGFAVFYIPVFAIILWALGLCLAVNRRHIFFLSWGLFFFLLSIPQTFVYQFLRDHIFFFKYFRNLHFFLWLALLPMGILFLVGQFQQMIEYRPRTPKEKYFLWTFLSLAHLGFMIFLIRRENAVLASCLTVVLSFIFFLLYFNGRFKGKELAFLFFLLVMISAEPLQTYFYLDQNTPRTKPFTGEIEFYQNRYDRPYLDFSFLRGAKRERVRQAVKGASGDTDVERGEYRPPSGLYYSVPWFSMLYDNIDVEVLRNYINEKFILYDRLEVMSDSQMDFKKIQAAFQENNNVAFVPDDSALGEPQDSRPDFEPQAQRIAGNGAEFQVLKFDSNSILFKTNFPQRKFVVYTDSFHKNWEGLLNGKKIPIIRANVAFKGIWVPAGENTVSLCYGRPYLYFFNVFLLGLFSSIFLYLFSMSLQIVSRKTSFQCHCERFLRSNLSWIASSLRSSQ